MKATLTIFVAEEHLGRWADAGMQACTAVKDQAKAITRFNLVHNLDEKIDIDDEGKM